MSISECSKIASVIVCMAALRSIFKDDRLCFMPASWRTIFALQRFLYSGYMVLFGLCLEYFVILLSVIAGERSHK